MKRRDVIKTIGLGAAAIGTGALVTACSKEETPEVAAAVAPIAEKKMWQWKMVTTWPANFPGLGTGATYLANLITELTDGQVAVKVYGAGELVPAMETFDAVSQGTAQLGHGAAYYWKGKTVASQFFAAVPFGLNAQEMNSWLYHGGGMELWEEEYAKHGLVPGAAGNTGVQMAGWFNKEINTSADLKGLKMRIPGLGGDVLKKLGGTPVGLPGGEIAPALQSGAIDATEWVGPYNDMAFGLHKVAKFYYYPGWHEPGTTLECMINKAALEELPKHLQAIVRNAIRVANQDMLAEFTARNNAALETLVNEHNVQLRRLPDAVLKDIRKASEEVLMETAGNDAMSKRVYESFNKFRAQAIKWHDVSERAYLNARADS